MKRKNVHLTDEQWLKLEAEHQRIGISPAELIRRAIDKHLGEAAMMPQSQFEIDAEIQLKIIEAALELNKLSIQAAVLGLGVHLNEKREMAHTGVEIVTVYPEVFRYVTVESN